MQNVLRAVNVRPAPANMLANDVSHVKYLICCTTDLISQHPNLPLQTISDLRMKWDRSKVKGKLVPSIAGKHEGWPNVILTGHARLMKAVRDVGLRTGKGKAAKDLVIESQVCLTSSIPLREDSYCVGLEYRNLLGPMNK
jgi:tyrosyl-DNA phosphodiesterase-1